MATRSTIALEFADGTVGMVYCHWDGYLGYNGELLAEHWTDPFKLRDLLDLGDLSSLGASIGEKHDFDCPFAWGTPEAEAWQNAKQKVCTFYGRDRGEDDVAARYFKDFAEYRSQAQQEEYNYVLRNVNGQATWYVSSRETLERIMPLTLVMESAKQEETVK